MLSLEETTDPYDEHHWWIYDPRMTSPKTCILCMALDGTHYRGDELYMAFPYHEIMHVNAIKAMVHPNCRCVLRWAGRSEDLLTSPYGLKAKPDKPEIPKKYDLTPDKRRQFGKIAKVAREVKLWKKHIQY